MVDPGGPAGPVEPPVQRTDVEALLATRRELGSDYDDALVASFVERVERSVQGIGQVPAASSARMAKRSKAEVALEAQRLRSQTALGAGSLIAGIPITAISASVAHLPGLGIAWAGIVGVNAAFAWASRAGVRRREQH